MIIELHCVLLIKIDTQTPYMQAILAYENEMHTTLLRWQ